MSWSDAWSLNISSGSTYRFAIYSNLRIDREYRVEQTMPFKDKEALAKYQKAYGKVYRESHSERIATANKKWRQENPERKRESAKKYRLVHPEKEKKAAWAKTPAGKMTQCKANWKRRGLDMETFYYVYPIYLATTHCDRCQVFLEGKGSARKCMDHCHASRMYRNTICCSCNARFRGKATPHSPL